MEEQNNQYVPEIPSLRKGKINRVEQKLRQLGYTERRIQQMKDYLYALCYHVIKTELDKQ